MFSHYDGNSIFDHVFDVMRKFISFTLAAEWVREKDKKSF